MTRLLFRASFMVGALCFGPVHAGPDSAAVLLGTEHVGESGFEEVNPGLFLMWEGAALQGRVDLGFGAFRNSYGDASVAVTAATPIFRRDDLSFDVFAALAWYPGNGEQFVYSAGDIVPLAGVQGRWKNGFVQVIPGGSADVDATITYGLFFDLN